MSDYASAAGFIQFDVKTREVNGQTVRDVAIRAVGSQKLISVTVWPEFDAVELERGDFIAVDGKFKQSLGQAPDGSPREYFNLSASALVKIAPAIKKERGVVQATTNGASVETEAAPF